MRRREFIGLVGGAAAGWPLAARAQQAMPVVEFLALSSADAPSGPVAPIHLTLKQAGLEVGQAVRMEYLYANNQSGRVPALAANLIKISPAGIISSGGLAPNLKTGKALA